MSCLSSLVFICVHCFFLKIMKLYKVYFCYFFFFLFICWRQKYLKDTIDSLLFYGDYFSLFREEINSCAAVHTRYLMDTCDRVRSIFFLSPMMGMSFLFVALTRLIVTEPKHWVTGVNFPFSRRKRIQCLSVSA